MYGRFLVVEQLYVCISVVSHIFIFHISYIYTF